MDILSISWDRICQSLLAILFYFILFTTRHFKMKELTDLKQ